MRDYVGRQDVLVLLDKIERRTPDNKEWIYQEARHEILNMPPADVRKVKRGHWVKLSGFATPGGDPVWGCSECGKGVHVYGIEASTYGADVADHQWVSCPNCGVIMDEVNNDGR